MQKAISERRMQAIEDHALYGDYQTGIYKGIVWEAQRCYSQSPELSTLKYPSPANAHTFHWCGYIQLGDLYEKKHKEFMCDSGKECTYRRDGTIGFDCAHCDDYPSGVDPKATYKDFPFVLKIIKDTIDKIKSDNLVV